MGLRNWIRKPRAPIKGIELIVFDFDGIFTDNRVTIDEEGKESVICNRADGLGVRMLRAKKIPLLILSSETNQVVAWRAQKLNIPIIYGIEDKTAELRNYCQNAAIDISKVMYVGNDLNDSEVMKTVGFPVAPKDAHPEIRRIARYVLRKKGGEGVIEELTEKLIF